MRGCFLKFLLILFSSVNLYADNLLLQQEKTCVAWQAEKKIAFLFDAKPLGKSCQVEEKFVSKGGDLYGLHLTVPIRSFDSGNSTRDHSVLEILGAPKEKNIYFSTTAYPLSKWQEFLAAKNFSLEGTLQIKSKSNPVTLRVTSEKIKDSKYFTGKLETSFTDLGLEAPSLLFGVGFQVKNSLSLLFQYKLDDGDLFLKSLQKGKTTSMIDKSSENEQKNNFFYNLKTKGLRGKNIDFKDFQNKVVVITNIASRCGLVGQLKSFEGLYKRYKEQGLIVLAFPSNDFYQEPLEGEKIGEFCRLNYGVSFLIAEKTHIKGTKINPIYKYLTQEAGDSKANVRWNFEKFILDRNGHLAGRFAPIVSPQSKQIIALIESLL